MRYLGVLDATSLWKEGATQIHQLIAPESLETWDIASLFTLAESHELAELWVHRPDAGAMSYLPSPAWNIWPAQPKKSWYQGYRQGGGRDAVRIVLTSLDHIAAWRSARDGQELLTQVRAYNTALRFDYRYSPGATSTALMREVHGGGAGKDKRYIQLEAPGAMPPPVTAPELDEQDIFWIRGLLEDEQDYEWVHAIDKNADYLGASGIPELGLGEWTHERGPKGLIGGSAHFTGPAYIHVDEVIGSYSMRTIPLLLPDPLPPEGVWCMAPTVNAAISAGYCLHFDEWYTWAHHARVLEPWQKRLAIARTALADWPLASQVLKQTYTHGLGWLGSDAWDRTGDMLYRPDWRHTIIAQAAANIWRAVQKAVNRDVRVVAVAERDTLYIVSKSAHTLEVAEQAGLKMGRGLGQWKPKGMPMRLDDVRPMLDAKRLDDRFERLVALQGLMRVRRGLMRVRREHGVPRAGEFVDGA
jgi:hypothetical protein